MHVTKSCISTEVAHLTWMRCESCLNESLLDLRSCYITPDQAFNQSLEDETCQKGKVSSGVCFLERLREEGEVYEDIFCIPGGV